MMLILRDDQVIEIFDSPSSLPNWIEPIDIENEEYLFCDDKGQRYLGVVAQRGNWRQTAKIDLQPIGVPDRLNAVSLVDLALQIETNERFQDLPSLRQYLISNNQ